MAAVDDCAVQNIDVGLISFCMYVRAQQRSLLSLRP